MLALTGHCFSSSACLKQGCHRGLVIVWHLLTDPTLRFRDLGPDFHTRRVNTDRKIRNLVHQLEVLGHTVTLQPAA